MQDRLTAIAILMLTGLLCGCNPGAPFANQHLWRLEGIVVDPSGAPAPATDLIVSVTRQEMFDPPSFKGPTSNLSVAHWYVRADPSFAFEARGTHLRIDLARPGVAQKMPASVALRPATLGQPQHFLYHAYRFDRADGPRTIHTGLRLVREEPPPDAEAPVTVHYVRPDGRIEDAYGRFLRKQPQRPTDQPDPAARSSP